MMRNIDELRLALRLPDAPMVNNGLIVTADFFRTALNADPRTSSAGPIGRNCCA
jgi:hypothetical protein